MSETIELHFTDGSTGFITFEEEGAARRSIANIDQARREGRMYIPVTAEGDKLHSYNPDHITWVREV